MKTAWMCSGRVRTLELSVAVVRSRRIDVHLWVHARPEPVDGSKLALPALRVALTLQELGPVALSIRPLVRQGRQRTVVIDMMYRKATCKMDLNCKLKPWL